MGDVIVAAVAVARTSSPPIEPCATQGSTEGNGVKERENKYHDKNE